MSAPCGTEGGYQAHRRNGTPPCRACLDYRAEATRKRRRRLPVAYGREKAAMRARQRAQARLSQEFDGRFRELYAEELAREDL